MSRIFLKVVDDVVQEALLLIQDAQFEIALGQGGLGAEAGIFHVGGAGRGRGLGGLHTAAHQPPDVQFPAEVEVHQVVGYNVVPPKAPKPPPRLTLRTPRVCPRSPDCLPSSRRRGPAAAAEVGRFLKRCQDRPAGDGGEIGRPGHPDLGQGLAVSSPPPGPGSGSRCPPGLPGRSIGDRYRPATISPGAARPGAGPPFQLTSPVTPVSSL